MHTPFPILTADGSSSLFVPELDEHYHSVHGAIQESQHVFIEAGLRHLFSFHPPELRILEVGLGTGLNALLTYKETLRAKLPVTYHALEKYPLDAELALTLNYGRMLEETEGYRLIHETEWEVEQALHPFFSFTKMESALQRKNLLPGYYDLIYFDAFGPRVQPEMWEESVLSKMAEALKPGGIWVSYCAKGEVKRRLKRVGLELEMLPGPPGKREMTRAQKPLTPHRD